MIEANKGDVVFKGDLVTLMAEATLVVNKMAYIVNRETGISQKDALKQMYKTAKEGHKNDDSND